MWLNLTNSCGAMREVVRLFERLFVESCPVGGSLFRRHRTLFGIYAGHTDSRFRCRCDCSAVAASLRREIAEPGTFASEVSK
jgi:hypothetical protein